MTKVKDRHETKNVHNGLVSNVHNQTSNTIVLYYSHVDPWQEANIFPGHFIQFAMVNMEMSRAIHFVTTTTWEAQGLINFWITSFPASSLAVCYTLTPQVHLKRGKTVVDLWEFLHGVSLVCM